MCIYTNKANAFVIIGVNWLAAILVAIPCIALNAILNVFLVQDGFLHSSVIVSTANFKSSLSMPFVSFISSDTNSLICFC